MLRFYRNIVLFLFPVVLVLLGLRTDRRYVFKELKDDCLSKGIWLYDRIHANTRSMDVLFMGSSHTINAIDDPMIDSCLNDTSLHVVNFGYCRYGRNFQYSLLKEVNLQNKPKLLFIEVRADENDFSHPIFPYMAESSDVLSSLLHYNKSYLKDLWTHGSYKLELSHERWFRTGDSLHIFPFDHGLKVAPDTADSQLLYLQQEEKKSFAPSAVSYLKLIAEYCMKNDIRLYFLYLPSYAEIEREPGFSRSYESMGELWVPPKEILLNKDHWFDKEHLNTTGSRALSRWLCERLNDELNTQN